MRYEPRAVLARGSVNIHISSCRRKATNITPRPPANRQKIGVLANREVDLLNAKYISICSSGDPVKGLLLANEFEASSADLCIRRAVVDIERIRINFIDAGWEDDVIDRSETLGTRLRYQHRIR